MFRSIALAVYVPVAPSSLRATVLWGGFAKPLRASLDFLVAGGRKAIVANNMLRICVFEWHFSHGVSAHYLSRVLMV
jgi:hypothetical protein